MRPCINFFFKHSASLMICLISRVYDLQVEILGQAGRRFAITLFECLGALSEVY